jgi:hypothetical protein
MHGNFYARNSHFEESRISDIQSYNEHGCTVRRCTSLGSQRFLEHFSIVSTMTVEGCTIQSWRDPNRAIQVGGAPVLLFDNTFLNFRIPESIAKGAVSFQNEQNKVLILSENRIVQLATPVASSDNRDPANENLPLDAQAWAGKATGRVFTIPAGHRRGVALAGDRQFLKSAVTILSKVFDARPPTAKPMTRPRFSRQSTRRAYRGTAPSPISRRAATWSETPCDSPAAATTSAAPESTRRPWTGGGRKTLQRCG